MRSAWASGDCAQSVSAPSGGSRQPSREVQATPRSQLVAAEIWFATPFAATAAWKRSVCPTSHWVMKPPYESPVTQARGIREALRDRPVADRELVLGIGPAPGAGDRLQPLAPIRARAAGVGAEHAIAVRREHEIRQPGHRPPARARAADDREHRRLRSARVAR